MTHASEPPGASGATALSDHERYLAARHFPLLDGLRGLSILPVVWHHSTPRPLPGLAGRGPAGVSLFFALSGFLIATLLVRERRERGSVDLGAFYARRAARIFPLYYAVLGLYVARALWLLPPSPMRDHFLANVPWFATYTANVLVDFDVPHPVVFAFSWSLAVEEQFYLLFPWVLRVTRGALAPAAYVLALLALDRVADAGALDPWLGRGVAFRAVTSLSEPIGLGVLLALALDSSRLHGWGRAVLGHRASAPLLLAAAVWMLAQDDPPLLALHASLAGLVGAAALREDGGLAWLLGSRALRHVGRVSYGVYLFHVAVVTLVKQLLPGAREDAPVVFALALPLSLALATASYRWFEAPLMARARRARGVTGSGRPSGTAGAS